MNGMSVIIGILGIVIDAILAPTITIPLWRAFSESVHAGVATMDLAWTDRVSVVAGDATLFGLIVVFPGFAIVASVAGFMRSR